MTLVIIGEIKEVYLRSVNGEVLEGQYGLVSGING